MLDQVVNQIISYTHVIGKMGCIGKPIDPIQCDQEGLHNGLIKFSKDSTNLNII